MKLLNRTSLYYLLFALPVFIVCSLFLYHYVSSEIQDNLDEAMWKEKIKAEQRLQEGKSIDDIDNGITIGLTNNRVLRADDKLSYDDARTTQFSDTLMYDSLEEETLPYRTLRTVLQKNDKYYLLTIRRSTIESDDLVESILYPVIILFILLLVGFLLINILIARRLWKPFYQTLDKLNKFSISADPVSFDACAIREFSEMNKALSKMTEKIRADYVSQKQFTENASHEIQTPLAVIRSKMELLIQSPALNEKDMQIIQSVDNAASKLSALNKGLLLLSKIGNDQFRDLEQVDLVQLLDRSLHNYSDIAAFKNIRIFRTGSGAVRHKMPPVLAESLLGNILQNAIRHNVQDGTIGIRIAENELSISNSSYYNIEDTSVLFRRFRKNESSADSIGLGLAIVKEICVHYQIRLDYTCGEKIHTITMRFGE